MYTLDLRNILRNKPNGKRLLKDIILERTSGASEHTENGVTPPRLYVTSNVNCAYTFGRHIFYMQSDIGFSDGTRTDGLVCPVHNNYAQYSARNYHRC